MYYSGIEFVFRKFIPTKKSNALPTGVIWMIGLYILSFYLASHRYETRFNIIQNRVNTLLAQLTTTTFKYAIGRISEIQNMECPEKPDFLKPKTIFNSILFEDNKNQEVIDFLKRIVEDYKADLAGVNFRNIDLQGVDLTGANLQGAFLSHSNLHNVILNEANLQGANLRAANLENAFFWKANLKEADLVGANLKNARLYEANLQGAILGLRTLRDADTGELVRVAGANLQGARIGGTNLQGANLSGVNLQGADLSPFGFPLGTQPSADNPFGKLNNGSNEPVETRLLGVIGLTIEQLCKVKSLNKAKLEKEVLQKVMDNCPPCILERTGCEE